MRLYLRAVFIVAIGPCSVVHARGSVRFRTVPCGRTVPISSLRRFGTKYRDVAVNTVTAEAVLPGPSWNPA